ncbi:hypothetical protein ThvES_00020020, partial [Thiovulum sp. ES]
MALSNSVYELSKDLYLKSRNNTYMDIVTFAESKSGLGLKLYPGQKFIFKLFYNMPLSDSLEDNKIVIRDQFNEAILHTF